ncbi:MAG TPA: hypothetical protein VII92_15445 [Anaerolineae bacterium]
MADPLTLEIDTSQIDQFVQRFPVTGPRIVERELRIGLDDALGYTVAQVVDVTPVNTGVLRESIYDDILGVKADISGVNLEGIVSSSDYEPKVNAVEFGRKPGRMPPVEAIALWVARKGLTERNPPKRRRVKITKREARRKGILSIAWAVATHIATKGTVGAAMFQKGFEASQAYIVKTMDEAIDRILNAWSKEG